MFKLILKLIKHLQSKGDSIGIQLCYDIGDQFIKEFKAINRAFETRYVRRKKK